MESNAVSEQMCADEFENFLWEIVQANLRLNLIHFKDILHSSMKLGTDITINFVYFAKCSIFKIYLKRVSLLCDLFASVIYLDKQSKTDINKEDYLTKFLPEDSSRNKGPY